MTLPTPEALADQVAELRLLWPVLPAALPADTGTGGGERVHISGNVHTIPINPAVAATIHRLTPLMAHLTQLTQQYADAYTNRRWADAAPVAHRVGDALADARTAIGLNRPDQPIAIGAHCPRHDAPLTPLVTPGERGELRYDSIAADGTLVGGWIRWTQEHVVVCRHCRQQWTIPQLLWLGRLVADADQRRRAASEAGAA
jgi:hypothetical protein